MTDGESVPLRVLVVEDSDADFALLLRELERGSYAPSHRRVDTPEALHEALEHHPWDIVLVPVGRVGLEPTSSRLRAGCFAVLKRTTRYFNETGWRGGTRTRIRLINSQLAYL